MDDERIRQLTQEVLSRVRGTTANPEDRSLEARVAALEAAVAPLLSRGSVSEPRAGTSGDTVVHIHRHPSQQFLQVAGGSSECILEPDKPCVNSGCCRVLGH